MRRVVMSLMMGALLVAVSACAFEPDGEEPDEGTAAASQDDRDLATLDVPSQDEGVELQSLDGTEPPGGPATNVTYYDGCRTAHQACHCQNTGWAGYCAWILWGEDDAILRCKCN